MIGPLPVLEKPSVLRILSPGLSPTFPPCTLLPRRFDSLPLSHESR